MQNLRNFRAETCNCWKLKINYEFYETNIKAVTLKLITRFCKIFFIECHNTAATKFYWLKCGYYSFVQDHSFIRNIATALVKLSFNIRLKLFNDTKWITTITKTKTGASESSTLRHFFLLISGVTSEQFWVLKATNIIKNFWDDVRSQLLIKQKACNLHIKDW